jgi:hypothetical protein
MVLETGPPERYQQGLLFVHLVVYTEGGFAASVLPLGPDQLVR